MRFFSPRIAQKLIDLLRVWQSQEGCPSSGNTRPRERSSRDTWSFNFHFNAVKYFCYRNTFCHCFSHIICSLFFCLSFNSDSLFPITKILVEIVFHRYLVYDLSHANCFKLGSISLMMNFKTSWIWRRTKKWRGFRVNAGNINPQKIIFWEEDRFRLRQQ